MYTYPEALDAMQKVATDLFAQAKLKGKFPKDKNITVRVTADASTGTASVDWNDYGSYMSVEIFLPVMPATYRMSANEFKRYAAYIYHEVGHPIETNKIVWTNAVATKRHKLLNSLEDVREENETNRSGIAVNGAAVLTELIESLHQEALANGYDPNEPKSIGWTLSFIGRAVCNGYKLDTHSVLSRLDANGPVAHVMSWAIPALGACRSTQECLDLADRVVAALPKRKPANNPPRSEPEQETGESEQGESEQGESEQGESEQGESEQGESEQGESEQGESEQGESEQGESEQGEQASSEPSEAQDAQEPNKAGRQGKEASSEPSEPLEPENEPLTHDDIEETSLAPKPKEKMQSNTKAFREAQVIEAIREAMKASERKPREVGKGAHYEIDELTRNAAKATRQRALLAKALRANDMDAFEGGRNKGRLDRKAFARKAAGSHAIFGKRVITEGYETDVAILIDGSGSMSGREVRVALQLALVIAQASAQVGVNCEAYIFNGGGSLHAITTGKKRPDVSKFAGAIQCVSGGTPLCASMLKAAFKQSARAQGKRRLLFAITDGADNMGISAMVATVSYIEKALGTEVINLMIGTPVTGAFRNEVSVVSSKNVCEVGLEQLTRQLAS